VIPPREKEPKKILIVKLSAIGDVVQTFPMVEALKKEFPRASIDWLVEEEASDLLFGHPALNRVIVSRRKSWLKSIFADGKFWETLGEIKRFIRDLRSENYDWVIDNHGIFKSGLLLFLSRGRRKIGFQPSSGIAEEGYYLFANERYPALSIERHALERYLDLISQMGVPVPEVTFEYPVPPAALEKAETLLRQNSFSRHPLVVIHPMAKWPTKQWPLENFAQLIFSLTAKGISVIITGSREDEEPVRQILHLLKGRPENHDHRILNLVGKTSLRELAGIFSLSDLVLTPDTGPMHLAAAVKAPLIALFGPTAPWRTGPYGNGNLIIRKALACSPCFKKKCSTLECMNTITVEEVLEAALRKLGVES